MNEPWEELEQGVTPWRAFSEDARDKIVRHFAPKVKTLALRLKAKLPQNVELDELISAGSVGLLEALDKFDPTLKIKFDTYSENRIRGAMLDELRKLDWFSRGLRQRMRMLEEAMRRVEQETGEPASFDQLEDKTGLSHKDIEQGLEALQNQLCLSLENIHESMALSHKSLRDNEPYVQTAKHEIIDKIAALIDKLTPREKLVLSLYYGDELNMREAAEIIGVTEGRISQLHSQALAKLKKMFFSEYGED